MCAWDSELLERADEVVVRAVTTPMTSPVIMARAPPWTEALEEALRSGNQISSLGTLNTLAKCPAIKTESDYRPGTETADWRAVNVAVSGGSPLPAASLNVASIHGRLRPRHGKVRRLVSPYRRCSCQRGA